MSVLHEAIRSGEFVVIVSPPKNFPPLARAAAEAGAHAVKVHLNVMHRASGNSFGSWTDEKESIEEIISLFPLSVGIMPGADTKANRKELLEAAGMGIEFFDIYAHDMPAWMLSLPMSAMVALGHDYSPDDPGALEELGAAFIEASIIHPQQYGKALTCADLTRYHAIAGRTSLPVIVPSQKHITPQDISVLKRTGVAGVMLGTISIGDTVESFQEMLPAFIEACRQ